MKQIRLFIALLALAALAGCRSTKNAQQSGNDVTQVVAPTVSTQNSTTSTKGKTTTQTKSSSSATKKSSSTQKRSTNVNAVSSKMNLKLEGGGKKVTCSGTYRLKRDDVIQINLVYTVLIVPLNVGTLELTRDSILLVDRMNKRYCRAAYSDVPELKKAGVDFDYMQRVFWGDDEKLKNEFVDCVYSDWTKLGSGKFPCGLAFTLKKAGSSGYKATFNLTKVQETSDWEPRTEIPSRYKAVPLKTVLNAIMSVAK